MIKSILFLAHVLLFVVISATGSISAQQKAEHYTYLTDKKFKKTNDLKGFEFLPDVMEIPGKDKKDIEPGAFKFGIAGENLMVKGGDIGGIYNINNINTTDYGFKLALMNARDPGMQGHLKVILLNKKFVDALVFKKSNDSPEIIFFLPEIPEEKRLKEKEYFTDRSEIVLEFADEVWGLELLPFYRVLSPRKKFQRIQMSDGVKVEFIETETIIEKTKKGPKKKDVTSPDVAFVDPPVDEETEEEVSEEQSAFDAFFGDEEEEEMVEEVMEEEKPASEEEQLDTYFGGDAKSETKEEREVIKKVKYEYEYIIKLTDLRVGDTGFAEPFTEEFKVKNIKMREDVQAIDPQYVFQIEFETNKGMVYMYLNNAQKISSMDFGPVKYLMRGH